jgi:hypothetical protein
MAKLIEAIRDYGPRLKLNSTLPLEVLVCSYERVTFIA